MKKLLLLILLLLSSNIYSQKKSYPIDYVQFNYYNEEKPREIQYVTGFLEVDSKTNDILLNMDGLNFYLEFTGDIEEIKDPSVKGQMWYYRSKLSDSIVSIAFLEDVNYIGYVTRSCIMYIHFKPENNYY